MELQNSLFAQGGPYYSGPNDDGSITVLAAINLTITDGVSLRADNLMGDTLMSMDGEVSMAFIGDSGEANAILRFVGSALNRAPLHPAITMGDIQLTYGTGSAFVPKVLPPGY